MLDDVFIFDNSDRMSLFYDEPMNVKNELIQTVKLFDGFFLGNVHACRDPQFINNNKIGLIINCHPLEISFQEPQPTKILTYNFHNKRGSVQQSISIAKVSQLFKEIEVVLNLRQEGVIVISKNLDSRVFCFAGVYLMAKYRWNFSKIEQFLNHKKKKVQIAEKYHNILKKFDNHHHKEQVAVIFEKTQSQNQEKLIQNTLANSIPQNFPNFYGFSHLKNDGYDHFSKKRSVKFLEDVEIINRYSQNLVKNQVEKTVVEQLEPPKKITLKLSTVESKLKSFIHEKCHPNQMSDRFIKVGALQFPKEDKKMRLKNLDLAPRRRAVSKTEESFDLCQQEQKQTWQNNYLEQPITLKQLKLETNHKQKNVLIEDFLNKTRPKMNSACNSKTQIPKRCYTEGTTYFEKESQSKVNSLFKISKTKTSTKKIYQDYYRRSKEYPLKSSEKHFRHFQTSIQEYDSRSEIEAKLASSLDNKKDGEKGSSMVNYNVNIHIDTLNVIQEKQSSQEGMEENRKQSIKVKKRTLPKRILRQTIIQ